MFHSVNYSRSPIIATSRHGPPFLVWLTVHVFTVMLSSLYNDHLSKASPSCQNKLLTRLVGSKLFDIDFSHFIFLRGRRGEGVGEGGGEIKCPRE